MGFMLAYHVWMDGRRDEKMTGPLVPALFSQHLSHMVCVMIGLRI